MLFYFLLLFQKIYLLKFPLFPFNLNNICYQTYKPFNIDGILSGEDWDQVPWTKKL